MADPRVFLDANVLFTAAYSPDGLSALLIELGVARRVTLLTSPLAIVEAERNLEAKRPAALPALQRSLTAVRIVGEPAPADVERLTPPDLSSKDRPLLAAAIVARATHFVTGDLADFGRWMHPPALPLHQASPVAAPGSTRMRGAAISVSPQSTLVAPITGLAGILEVASLIPSEPQCSAPGGDLRHHARHQSLRRWPPRPAGPPPHADGRGSAHRVTLEAGAPVLAVFMDAIQVLRRPGLVATLSRHALLYALGIAGTFVGTHRLRSIADWQALFIIGAFVLPFAAFNASGLSPRLRLRHLMAERGLFTVKAQPEPAAG